MLHQPEPLKKTARPPWSEDSRTLASRLDSIPSARFSILGEEIDLRSDSDRLLDFFRHAYRWFPPGPGEPDFLLAAVFSPEPAGRPFAMAGERYLDLSNSASPENRAFLFLLESIMDRIDGSILVHAGAVRSGSAGVMIAGPAFAGKSTLVVELVKLGAGFMSDDAAPLERGTGRLLPYPRAVGIRKPRDGTGRSAGVENPDNALELPHRWLLNPEELGARLPAGPCEPAHLFYLDPGPEESGSSRLRRKFEIAMADDDPELMREIRGLSDGQIRTVDGRAFHTVHLDLSREGRPAGELMDLWRRSQDKILYVEEIRPEPVRSEGAPRIDSIELGTILVSLVRDVLNRGEGGRLMAAHQGRLTSLTVELGSLLGRTRCHRLTGGSPAESAKTVWSIVTGSEVRS